MLFVFWAAAWRSAVTVDVVTCPRSSPTLIRAFAAAYRSAGSDVANAWIAAGLERYERTVLFPFGEKAWPRAISAVAV